MLSKFSGKMQRLIITNLKFREFRGIQKKAIPPIFAGENVLLIAPTASGKTEAFLLPLMDLIYTEKLKPTSMLYISPIKALINNQFSRFQHIGRFLDITSFKWHGDVESSKRKQYLNNPTDILLITPESLEVILFNDNYKHTDIFYNLRFIIIDEIHAFAGDVRGVHLLSLLERIEDITGESLQRIGLSATIGNPEEMGQWLQGGSLKLVQVIIDKGVRKKKVKLMYFNKIDKRIRNHILAEAKQSKSLFFTNSRSDTEKMYKLIHKYPIETYVHHSSIDKHLRERAEERFRIKTKNNIIIFCTSTLELGIDIGDLDKVLQLNPPYRVADFLQRIGRSGRQSNLANTVIYNKTPEDLIRSIAIINLVRKGFIEPIYFRKKAWDILFHQILALVHQEYQIKADKLYSILNKVYSFKTIYRDEFSYLINYMLELGYLTDYKGKLMIGEKTEKEFGYANYYNFFSVFENINEYTIISNHEVIGTLDSFYINTLDESDINFFLAGKIWSIKSIDEKRLRVYVEPAEKGKMPFWISTSGLMSRCLAEEIYRLICADEEYFFLNERELKILKNEREKFKGIGYEKNKILIEQKGNEIKIHSFAGDRINLTLGLFLRNELDANKFNFKYNQICLKFENKKAINLKVLENLLEALKKETLILSSKMLRNMIDELPLRKISKYYDYLPRLLQKELIEDLFFDVEGSINFLKFKNLKY